ncbi:MAG: hypothetical protein K8R21_00250 [Leptospira sp.]|nr:hypothetical protein [Leptospira sp.]
MIKFFLAAFFLLFSTIGAKDLSVAAESDYISPNFDGFRDTVKFRIDFDRDIKIKNWIFTLTDESGKPVRSFRADLRHKRRRNFLFYLFSAETELTPLDIELPEFIEWSGNDPDGKILPDGKYNYQVTVYQENSLEKKSPERSIYLDSNFPKSEVKTDSRFFSPNKDKFQDILNLKQSAKGASDDRWQGVFYNYKGVPVKSYFWDSKSVPANFNWDGRDESGNQLENGLYRYRLTGEDKAGNRSVAELAWIVLNQDQMVLTFSRATIHFRRMVMEILIL